MRLALGASPGQVFAQVIGQGLRLAVHRRRRSARRRPRPRRRSCEGLLFNTSATDPVVYAVLAVLLLAMAALACYVPARRAMRVDPDDGAAQRITCPDSCSLSPDT